MKWTVKQVAEAKGIKNARELGDSIGASYSSIYPIWDGSAKRADLATLNKLCNLLDVPVGMLLTHIPDTAITPIRDPQESAPGKPAKPARKRAAKA